MDGKEETPGSADLRIGVHDRANTEIGVPGNSANTEIRVPGSGVPGAWSSRGYLPHFDDGVATQHVTFHLADSLPKQVVERMAEEIDSLPPERQDVERRKRVAGWLDAGHGSCVLREPAVAAMVEDAMLFFDGERYRLLAWVVMPNHVHVLFQPLGGWTVKKIVGSWKKFTATKIAYSGNADLRIGPGNPNLRIRERPGNADLRIGAAHNPNTEIRVPRERVWHPEFWDRYIRDARHFGQAVEYIHQNPVKAGLCRLPEEWRWSSARRVEEEKSANTEIRDPDNSANTEIRDPDNSASTEIRDPDNSANTEIRVPGTPE